MAATKVKFTSPFGAAKYPHISSPDTKGKYADNKYKTKLVMSLEDPEAVAFMVAIDEAATDIHGKAGAKLYKPYVADEESGEITFIFKTNFAPAIFDASNNEAPRLKIGNGSVLRLMGSLVGFEKGISAQFNQVQVRELNGFGSSGFDAVEGGYEYDQSDSMSAAAVAAASDTAGEGSSNASSLEI
jgi:hypothetical protein